MKIKELLQNYKRVLSISHKPSKDEFLSTVRICAIGLLLIGVIGFLIYLVAISIGL